MAAHKKRGLKKGHKKSAKWRAAISAGMRRSWKSGAMAKYHGKGKRKHRGHSQKRKRRARGTAHPYGKIAEGMMTRKRRKSSGTRKKRTRYLTHDPKTGKSYF